MECTSLLRCKAVINSLPESFKPLTCKQLHYVYVHQWQQDTALSNSCLISTLQPVQASQVACASQLAVVRPRSITQTQHIDTACRPLILQHTFATHKGLKSSLQMQAQLDVWGGIAVDLTQMPKQRHGEPATVSVPHDGTIW